MAVWERKVQWKEGGIPGCFGTSQERMVAFNTGQVLQGWGAYIRKTGDVSIRESALQAGKWLSLCQAEDGAWERGVSSAADHGRVAYMSMVSWGLAELYLATGEAFLRDASLRGARFCAGMVGKDGWPDHCGIRERERDRPLSHTIGYAIQGLFETGIILEAPDLVDTAIRMARGATSVLREDGFLPGRIGPRWTSCANWSCLTGTAQVACVWLRVVETGKGEEFLPGALAALNYIRRTQRRSRNPGIHFGVRGSYPLHPTGYCRLTYPNWAQKFFVDALLTLHRIDSRLLEE
jgi:hypothetical protein